MSLRRILLEAADIAADVHMEYFGKRDYVLAGSDAGACASDALTQADIESEIKITEHLQRNIPGIDIFAEETGRIYGYSGTVAIIDPLDQTRRFIQGYREFGTIIGIYQDGENIASLVSNSALGIRYVATKDEGLERIGPRNNNLGGKAIVLPGSIQLGNEAREKIEADLRTTFPRTHVQRRPGVLSMVQVMTGRYRGFVNTGLAAHDLAALPLLAKLTHTTATDHLGQALSFNPDRMVSEYDSGEKLRIYSYPVVIGKGSDHGKMLKCLEPYVDELGPK